VRGLLAIPGALWASADLAHKLVTSVMQVVAEAKSAEEETRRLAPIAAPKALSPPRIEKPTAVSPLETVDDDIPF